MKTQFYGYLKSTVIDHAGEVLSVGGLYLYAPLTDAVVEAYRGELMRSSPRAAVAGIIFESAETTPLETPCS